MWVKKAEEIKINSLDDDKFKEYFDKLSVTMKPIIDMLVQYQIDTTNSLKPIIEATNYYQKQLSDGIASYIGSLNLYVEKTRMVMEPIYKEMPKLIEVFSKLQRTLEFLNVLSENLWPMQLYDKNSFIEVVLRNNDNIDETIVEYFTIEKLEVIKDYLMNFDPNREEIYKEAFDNYYVGKFYSCVSLLICQIDELILNESGSLKFNEQIEKSDSDFNDLIVEINKIFKVNYDEKTKHNRFKLLIATYEDVFLPRIKFLILFVETYKSTNNKEKWKKLPYRNKICHGKQVNFGTRIHALKTIFLVYGLCKINAEYEENNV